MLQRASRSLIGLDFSRLTAAASSYPATADQYRSFASQASEEPRSIASYSIYKGKGALQFEYIPPTWSRFTSKANNSGLEVEKPGTLFVQAAPVSSAGAAKVGAGARTYDWDRKIVVALSAIELGSILNQEVGGKCEFFHDPQMNTPAAGQTAKRISIQRQADGSRFFGISESKGGKSQQIAVPLTPGEYAVLAVLAEILIPSILGFDRVMQQPATLEKA